MILINGCSFTSGEESTVAWPSLLSCSDVDVVNLATPGASNDYILRSTVDYIDKYKRKHDVCQVIIAWTSPNRIEISGKHLTPGSFRKYGDLVDAVFKDWDYDWAYDKFCSQVSVLHGYLEENNIDHFFVSAFDIQGRPRPKAITCPSTYFGWPDDGMVEWMGNCPKGPGGHPLELGHQRIAERINEHIRNLRWFS